jgi:SAM-dependent methyltransferase
MCRRAVDGSRVTAVRGRSQRLPFTTAAFTLVYFHLSIHYGDWRGALDEAARVLAPEGSIEIWTLASRHHQRSNLASWFPSIAAIDSDRFPEPAELERHLRGLGFLVERSEETEIVDRRVGSWVAAVRGGFVSTLQLLSATELEEGLGAFVRAHPDPDARFRYELLYDRVAGLRPPLLLPDEQHDRME